MFQLLIAAQQMTPRICGLKQRSFILFTNLPFRQDLAWVVCLCSHSSNGVAELGLENLFQDSFIEWLAC